MSCAAANTDNSSSLQHTQASLHLAQSTVTELSKENTELQSKLGRLEIDLRRQDGMLRAKGLREKTNLQIPDAADATNKPQRHTLGGGGVVGRY